MIKTNTIAIMLMVCSPAENHWSDDPEEDAKQRARYGEPERNVPARVLSC